jgi:hypothetical protein
MDCAENSDVEWGMDGKEVEKCCKFSSNELYLTLT